MLRFTGLGNSDGDFSNTTFSSNIDDLVRAKLALREHYLAPQLLISHSLGGAAVLDVAAQLDSIKAVVTIGAPATAHHAARRSRHGTTQALAGDRRQVPGTRHPGK